MAAPKGVEATIIDKKQLANSNWQLARGWYLVLGIWYLGISLRPSAYWDLDWVALG
jgi:hypothetical protein